MSEDTKGTTAAASTLPSRAKTFQKRNGDTVIVNETVAEMRARVAKERAEAEPTPFMQSRIDSGSIAAPSTTSTTSGISGTSSTAPASTTAAPIATTTADVPGTSTTTTGTPT